MDRCDELGAISRPDVLERVHLSPEHARAQRSWSPPGWRRPACARWQDAAGNQCGTPRGRATRPARAAARLAPRHRAATPGATTACSAWCSRSPSPQRLRDRRALPFALEVVGFSDEEGTRFGKALLGSRARRGQLGRRLVGPARPRRRHAAPGVRRRSGSTRRGSASAARAPGELVGYLEAHIEQGPVPRGRGPLARRTSPPSRAPGGSCSRSPARPGTRAARRTPAAATRWSAPARSSSRSSGWRAPPACLATVGRIQVQPGGGQRDPRPRRAQPRPARRDRRASATCAAEQIAPACARDRRAPRARLRGRARPTAPTPTPCAPWLREAVASGIRRYRRRRPDRAVEPRRARRRWRSAAVTDVGDAVRALRRRGISHHPDETVELPDVARGPRRLRGRGVRRRRAGAGRARAPRRRVTAAGRHRRACDGAEPARGDHPRLRPPPSRLRVRRRRTRRARRRRRRERCAGHDALRASAQSALRRRGRTACRSRRRRTTGGRAAALGRPRVHRVAGLGGDARRTGRPLARRRAPPPLARGPRADLGAHPR